MTLNEDKKLAKLLSPVSLLTSTRLEDARRAERWRIRPVLSVICERLRYRQFVSLNWEVTHEFSCPRLCG